MINTSNEYKEAIKKNRTFDVDVKITLSDGREVALGREQILASGLTVKDGVSGTSNFEIGAAIVNQCTIMLDNTDERYNEYIFDDAVVDVKIGLVLKSGTEFLKKGKYIIANGKYTGAVLALECLDYMVKFDKPYTLSSLKYPATLREIVRDACSVCEVSLGVGTFENDEYIVKNRPSDNALTFRQVLSWIGQICCKWWKCNVRGELVCGWYDTAEFTNQEASLDGGNFETNGAEYVNGDNADGGTFIQNTELNYDGGTFRERKYHVISSVSSQSISMDDVVITGVKVAEDGEKGAYYQTGEEGYVLEISGNKFIQVGDGENVVSFLGQKLKGMKFRPLSISCLSDPSIEAGDAAVVTDRKGRKYQCYITNTTFTIGGYQNVSCDAKSANRQNASRYGNGTQIYEELKQDIANEKSQRELAIKKLAEMLSNSGGLFMTVEEQSDGSFIYYAHNKPTLEESDIIWKFTAEAIGISTDGGKTWPYGFMVTGEMITKILYTEGIDAEWIRTGAFEVRDSKGKEVFYVNVDTGTVRINADILSIKGESVGEVLERLEQDKNGTYYGNYAPGLNNKPANGWNNEYELHNGDYFIDVRNGDMYLFKSGVPGVELKFSEKSATESATFDYVEIFVQESGTYKSLGKFGGKDFGGTRVLIPATTFWLYWRTDSSVDKHYGFSIDSIKNVIVTEDEYTATTKDLPSYTVTNVSGTTYPESEHLPYGNNINKLWKYTGTTSTVKNGWTQVPKLLAQDIKDVMDPEMAMNILTDDGRIKGIYMDGEEMYINATYIKSGMLKLGGISNALGLFQIDDAQGRKMIYADNKKMEMVFWPPNEKLYGSRISFSVSSAGERSNAPVRVEQFKPDGSYTQKYLTIESDEVNIRDDEYDEWLWLRGSMVRISEGASFSTISSSQLFTTGSIVADGTKNRVSRTKNYSDRLLYCYEMATPMFGDIGEAVTDENGECYIFLDDIFRETVNTMCGYQVFLQKEGQGDLWVEHKAEDHFLIKGTSNLKFAWEIKIKQKDFEFERLNQFDREAEAVKEINYEHQGMKMIEEYEKNLEGMFL